MNIYQLTRTLLFFKEEDSSQWVSEYVKDFLLKFRTVTLLFALFPPLSTLNSDVSWLLQWNLPPVSTFPRRSLFASTVLARYSYWLSTWSMRFRNLLDYFISHHNFCLPNNPPLPHFIVDDPLLPPLLLI